MSSYSRLTVLASLLGLFACARGSKSVQRAPPAPAQVQPSAAGNADDGPNPANLFSAQIAACTRGETVACHRLATRVLDGARRVETRRYVAAFQAGCERSIPDACAGLSLAERDGVVPGSNREKGLQRLMQACAAGSSVGCAAGIEDQIRHTSDADEKRKLIGRAGSECERLGGSICFTVGSYYASGDGVPADEKEALRWLTRGCQTGSAYACFYQAMAEAEGGAADRARPLYEKACADDVGEACLNLAYGLFKAGGQAEKAKEVGRRGCALGDPKACDFLASTNEGMNLDEPEKAYPSEEARAAGYERYCKLGGADACTQRAFELGDSAEKSGQLEKMEPVLLLLQQGCSRGSSGGCNVLGHVVKDAIRACEAGDAGECLVAGFAYTQGVSMPSINGPTIARDAAKAKAAFQRACTGGRKEGCGRAQ